MSFYRSCVASLGGSLPEDTGSGELRHRIFFWMLWMLQSIERDSTAVRRNPKTSLVPPALYTLGRGRVQRRRSLAHEKNETAGLSRNRFDVEFFVRGPQAR